MLSVAATFIRAILTAHSYSQIILQRNRNYSIEVAFLQSDWFLLHLGTTLMIIYYSSLLTNEVIWTNKHNESQSFKKHFTFQGKRTFRIVHDVIICCEDSDVIQLVKWKMFDFRHLFREIKCFMFHTNFLAGPIVPTDTAS